MGFEIQKVRVRSALQPRREPYWGGRLAKGQSLGFRKISEGEGSWVARMQDDGGVYRYEALGVCSPTFGYDEAKVAAEKWFAKCTEGVTSEAVTVEAACKEYVEDRRREKSEACAHDAHKRFERTVYGTTFGRTLLEKLRAPTVRTWRSNLKLGKAGQDRTASSVKAALHLAVANKRCSSQLVHELSLVTPHGAEGTDRRKVFLDVQQRRDLLARTQGALTDLGQGAALTGARPGELVSARVRQFEPRTGSMTFKGKTGARTVPVSPSAIALLKRLSRSKLPDAFLFMRDDGLPWAHSDWDELIAEAAQLARLPAGTVLYSLRHSWITEALLGGMATLEVARLCGTSVAMIEKHYGHLVNDVARERLARVVML